MFAAVVAILALTLAGCSTAPIDTGARAESGSAPLRSGPTTAVISQPDIVPVATDPPAAADASRIIAIDRNGTLGAIVYSLGLGPRVVGRDKSTTFRSALGVPVVTETGHAVNTEKVLDRNPSIVLTGTDVNPSGAADQLRAAGVRVEQFSAQRSVASTPDLIRSVARALGVVDAGEKLVARTRQQIDAARSSIPDPSGDPRIAFLYIRGERLTLMAGPGSGADDLIEHLGGVDAGTASGLSAPFTQVSTESMMRADPDVILVMTQGADSVGGLDRLLTLPTVAPTRAARHKRVVAMDETQILMFGPDTGLVLDALAKAIYA